MPAQRTDNCRQHPLGVTRNGSRQIKNDQCRRRTFHAEPKIQPLESTLSSENVMISLGGRQSIGLRSRSHRFHAPFKMQVQPRKRMVEIHDHTVQEDFRHHTDQRLTIFSLHRHDLALLKD